MNDNEPLDTRARAARFAALLTEHADATVAAVTIEGHPLPWPESIPLQVHQVVQDRSMFELAAPADHAAVLGAFQAALFVGAGHTRARLTRDPQTWISIHYVDLREDFGIIARLMSATAAPLDERPSEATTPRFGILRQSATGLIIGCDDSYAALWGGPAEDLVGRSVLDFIHTEDQAIAIEAWLTMMTSRHSQRFRYRGIRADGSLTWREVTLHNRLGEPDVDAIVAEVIDVSEEVAAHQALRANELRLDRMAQVVPVGLVEIDTDGDVVYANDRLHEILGTTPCETLADLLRTVVPGDRARIDEAFDRALTGSANVDIDVEVRRPTTGERRRCRVSVRSASDALERITGAIACVSDVTRAALERLELERDLMRHAFHDPVTGLANRTRLMNSADDAVTRAAASDHAVALILADLDGFKAINDSLGHGVGDELLRQVSDRLRSILQPGDTAARVGGDEFVLLLEGYLDPDRPRRIAEQVLTALAQPFQIGGRRALRISASIGIATTTTAQSTEELLREADLAMYRAKSTGRGRYELFAREMHEAVLARVDLETSLRDALDKGRLEVFYQPIHQLDTGRVTSAEALVRWRHPARGLVSPAEFIPLAEETGLIIPIGGWVLEQACVEAASWADLVGAAAPMVSVNLSALQLTQTDIVDDVHRVLRLSGLDPARLVLEITESLLMDGTPETEQIFHRLHGLGVQLSIDDFGTGYSSLAYLQNLPFDILKVDRAFVARLGHGHTALVEGILGLARALGLRAVAEGIETPAELDSLRALGCEAGQGFLFSRPVDREAVRGYLEQNLVEPARALAGHAGLS
jgi:diguanylate cyclase (GGDEF)-like protein/PAS domain S-box-containing protein